MCQYSKPEDSESIVDCLFPGETIEVAIANLLASFFFKAWYIDSVYSSSDNMHHWILMKC